MLKKIMVGMSPLDVLNLELNSGEHKRETARAVSINEGPSASINEGPSCAITEGPVGGMPNNRGPFVRGCDYLQQYMRKKGYLPKGEELQLSRGSYGYALRVVKVA